MAQGPYQTKEEKGLWAEAPKGVSIPTAWWMQQAPSELDLRQDFLADSAWHGAGAQ